MMGMIVVEDSMVLIFLAKLDLIEATKKMFDRVIISKAVEKETVSDAGLYPDAIKIRHSVENGSVEVREAKNVERVEEIMKDFGLGRGEAETIQVYFQEKADLLLCDEKKARGVADVLNINMLGTPELVIQLFKRKFVDKNKAMESILKLEKIGWFKPSIIFNALNEIGDGGD